jgi:hypothetical protein
LAGRRPEGITAQRKKNSQWCKDWRAPKDRRSQCLGSEEGQAVHVCCSEMKPTEDERCKRLAYLN